ncbi:MAG: DNA methyltransferase, partial [Candidatus Dormibacteria bacterium]
RGVRLPFSPSTDPRKRHNSQYLDKPFMNSSVDEQGRFYVDTLLRDVFEGVVNIAEDDGTISQFNTRPVLNVSRERIGYPTQKPEGLVQLLLRVASSPGDLVLDAFVGSGTTAVAAQRLHRRWIAIDSGKLAVYTSQKRLLQMADEPEPVSFVAAAAGLYDLDRLQSLPWAAYRKFSLDLFECRDQPHSIRKVAFDGFRGLDHVLVFNFQQHPEAVMGESYVEDLHKAVGKHMGRQVFLIAPVASVGFLQDYIELAGDGHPVRYYVLRIPYSIIEELHQRGFTRLEQPRSEGAVNETVDSIGFDFIRPPLVECAFNRDNDQLGVEVLSFESQALDRGEGGEGLSALAMIMTDPNYDGSNFHVDVDKVVYANELSRCGYRFFLRESEVGARLMFVYVDIYGNESRIVKSREDFLTSGAAS